MRSEIEIEKKIEEIYERRLHRERCPICDEEPENCTCDLALEWVLERR